MTLQYDELLLSTAFDFNLRRYSEEVAAVGAEAEEGGEWGDPSGCFVRMVDLTGFSDLASVVSPPEGCEFARDAFGALIVDYRGGGTVLVGVNSVSLAAAVEPTVTDGGAGVLAEDVEEGAAASKEDEAAAAGGTGGEEEEAAAAATAAAAPSTAAMKLCVYILPPGHHRANGQSSGLDLAIPEGLLNSDPSHGVGSGRHCTSCHSVPWNTGRGSIMWSHAIGFRLTHDAI